MRRGLLIAGVVLVVVGLLGALAAAVYLEVTDGAFRDPRDGRRRFERGPMRDRDEQRRPGTGPFRDGERFGDQGPDDPDDPVSRGEAIFFGGVDAEGRPIPRSRIPMQHHLAASGCATCHGPDGEGGRLLVRAGDPLEAPDIRYEALTSPHEEDGEEEPAWDDEDIARAVREGEKPDGERLDRYMPRWDMDDDEVSDLIGFLKTL